MRVQTIKKIRKMKQLCSILVALIVVLGFIIWSVINEYKSQGHNIDILRNRTIQLDKRNKALEEELITLKPLFDSINLVKINLDRENKKLRNGVIIKEKELKNIKGQYKNLSNDSLLLSLKKAYEIDSISSIDK